MKPSCLAALAGALLLGTLAHAGINEWTLTGPEGGAVTAVAIHPTDPLRVLASAGNGMYRSADGGLTWTRAGVGGWGTDIVFDPANSNRVFVVASGIGFYRSDDAGQTFAVASGPASSTPLHIAISGDGTIYIVDGTARVFRSSDVGVTWIQTASGWPTGSESASAIAVDRAHSNVVYVAVSGVGIFKSTDSGANWGAPLAGSPGTASTQTAVFQIVIKPDDSNRILAAANDGAYVSVNGGTAWSIAMASYAWHSIAFDPAANNNVVGVSYLGQINRSSDGGLTWPTVQRGPELRVQATPRVVYGPAGKVIVATYDGPMVSTDAGITFALRVSGMRAQSVRSFSAPSNGVMFVAFDPGPFGIYRLSGDWVPVDNVELNQRLNYPSVSSVTVASSNPLRLRVIGGGGLVSSFDGGQSWSSPHPQFPSGTSVLLRTVVDPTNEMVVYVLTQNSGVWKSENSGSTYTQRSTGLPTGINALTVDRTNPQVLYAGGYFTGATGVFKSTDGGLSWTPTGTLPDQLVVDIVLDPANASVVYAVLASGIHKSTNGGGTWTPLDMGGTTSQIAARGLVFDPRLSTTMFVANTSEGAGFARSIDGGASWQNVRWNVLPSLGSLDFFALDPLFQNVVLAGGYGTGLYAYNVANDLRINLPSEFTFALGATGTLTIPMENLGPFHAAFPELQLNIPSSLTVTTVPAGCRLVAPSMVCTLPSIRVGETRNFSLSYTASATPAVAAMGVYLLGRELDLVDNNNQRGVSVYVKELANLGVTATGTASVLQNAAVTYTATVTNSGPNSSTATRLVVLAPSGITVQTSTPTTGTCTVTGGSSTCELGTLASGATASVTLAGTATQVGAQNWSSTVSSTSAEDSVAANNTATLVTTVTAPPLPPSSRGGGGGGGGRFDWLALTLLGGLVMLRGKWGHSSFPCNNRLERARTD